MIGRETSDVSSGDRAAPTATAATAATVPARTAFRRVRPWLLPLALVVLLAYVALATYLFVYQKDLIFRPRRVLAVVPASLKITPEPLALRGANGTPLAAWRVRAGAPDRFPNWVVYLHGNDATRASDGNVARYDQLRSLGLNILAPEYPGYADVAGEPSEAGLHEAARAAYDFLRRHEGIAGGRIVIYGWSLGSGAATPLARDVDEAALILEGAFSSVLRRAQAEYPFLPISWLVRHPFLSEDAMGATGSPTLFLHSPEDRIIPFSDGERLFARARAPKQLVRLRGGHVTPNLDDEDLYLSGIHAFLTTQAGWTLIAPRRSTAVAVRAALDRRGPGAAAAAYAQCRAEGPAIWNLAEYELEHIGRRLLLDDRVDEAVAMLRLNAEAFPQSAHAAFHLGRAHAAARDVAPARREFQRSLALEGAAANPSHAALAALR